LLINKPHSVIYSLSKGKRLGSTYDSILLHILTNTFIIMFSNFKLTHVNSRSLIRLSAQKNILKLFFLPTQVNSTAFKAPLFAYNPICNSFFFKNYINNNTKVFYLFYDLGFLNKKVIFFSMKKNLVNITNILTYSTFNNYYPLIFLKLLYVMTKKRVKTRKKKLKKILNRFKAYAIFYLSLPKSKKFLKYLKETSLLTLGLTNSNLFELNVPVMNNWLTYKFMYVYQIYEYYRLGAYNRQFLNFQHISYKLNYLYNVFFLKNK